MIKKNLIWIIIATTLILLVTLTYFLTRKKPSKITYHEAKVLRESFVESVISTGSVSPENRLVIKPPIAGRVDQILAQEGQRVKKGDLLAWVSTTERAALIDSARAEGESVLAQWQQFYKATPIYAPINGMIILRSLEPGQSFNSGDGILVMSDRLTIKTQVDETSIAKVKLNQKAEVILDAYPNEKLEAVAVHIGFDAKTVNNVTGYVVDVLPKRAPNHMLSGMTANVKFILSEIPDALTLPSEALQTDSGKPCVKIRTNDDPESSPCSPIRVGPSNESRTVVLEGLSEASSVWVQDLKPTEFKSGSGPKNPFSPMGAGRPRH
jgi:macrolide-specific efflux system membrane fusion protein